MEFHTKLWRSILRILTILLSSRCPFTFPLDLEYSLSSTSPLDYHDRDCLLIKLLGNGVISNDIVSVSFNEKYISFAPVLIMVIDNATQVFNKLSHVSLNKSQKLIVLGQDANHSGMEVHNLKAEVEGGSISSKVFEAFDVNSQVYVGFYTKSKGECDLKAFSIWEVYSIKKKPFLKYVGSVSDLLHWIIQSQHEEGAAVAVRRQDWEGVTFTAGVFVDFQSDGNKYEIGVQPNIPGLEESDYKLSSSYSAHIYWDLQQALNFTERLKVFDSSNKFHDAFQQSEDSVDLVLGHFGVTDEKRNIAEALRPTFFSGVNAYFIQPPAHTVRNIYAKPFSSLKWLMILLMWLLIGIVLHILHYLQQQEDKNLSHLHLNWCLISVFCQQGCSTHPSSISTRFVLLTGLLFSFLCYTIFTGALVSDLWVNFVPIRNLQSLLTHSKSIYMSKDSDVSRLVARGMKQYAPNLLSKVKFHNLTTAFWKVSSRTEETSCLLAWPDYFTGSGRKLLQNYENVDQKLCDMFSSFKYTPFPMKVAMFVRKWSSFTPILNYRIAIGLERGLISRNWRQYEMNTKLECIQKTEVGRELELLDIILAFFILMGGFGLSLGVLVVETGIKSGVKWYHLCNQL